ncbi:hypothetical protein BG015_008503 [Linnemannia schmuckeri]|uniref:F-box protein n=1 Tax=Linnemannia schmuckeri TaxID=64567 RepID=A0A9P5S9Q3_9FUNG|nr:hypothetical protein BG015_008503 [Linnemannia schmuckeri]
MEPVTTRFFNINELVALLTNRLDPRYRNVSATFRPDRSNIFGSDESVFALAKHVHLVRELDLEAISTQVCWILQLSSHLQQITLKRYIFKDDRDICLLTTSIFGLEKLQELSLSWIPIEHPLTLTLFFSCPSSLQALDMELYEYYDQEGEYDDDYGDLGSEEVQSWEKGDGECGLTSAPRRQEPLIQLKSLNLKAVEEDVSVADLLSILQHCPNVSNLAMPKMDEITGTRQVAVAIAGSCPALSDMSYRVFCEGMANGELTLQIMDLLSQQQFKGYRGNEASFELPELDAVSLFRRHSSALQSLSLDGCRNFDSKAIQVLLTDCQALEVLEMRLSVDMIGALHWRMQSESRGSVHG